MVGYLNSRSLIGGLIEQEIRQIPSRAHHPQTNGQIERFFKKVDEKIRRFKSIVSLNLKTIEALYQTYIRKMPKEGIITDEESGETYRAQKITPQQICKYGLHAANTLPK
jgi:transposase InsO family protein